MIETPIMSEFMTPELAFGGNVRLAHYHNGATRNIGASDYVGRIAATPVDALYDMHGAYIGVFAAETWSLQAVEIIVTTDDRGGIRRQFKDRPNLLDGYGASLGGGSVVLGYHASRFCQNPLQFRLSKWEYQERMLRNLKPVDPHCQWVWASSRRTHRGRIARFACPQKKYEKHKHR